MINNTYILITCLLLSLVISSTKITHARTLFFDDFNNSTLSALLWTPYYYNPEGKPMINGDGSIADWKFINGMCGMTVSITPRGSQASFLFPKEWDNNWKNYTFQVDFKITDGVDTNLILKFSDQKKWYGIHGINDINRLVFETAGQNWSIGQEYSFAFDYNTWYQIKSVIKEGGIKVTIKNLATNIERNLWNISNSNIVSTEGKPCLAASTGAVRSVEVWFDNVLVTDLDGPDPTPTPTPTPTPSPITVLIPGLGGSFSFKGLFLNDENADDWQTTPGAHVYNNILKAFDEDPSFYTFHYDWRKSVLDSAQKLNSFIEEKIGNINAKANIIGHSLGGLVGRACIEKYNGCHASKLITVGSPHLGVVDVYPAVQGGEIWRKGIMKLAFELLVHYYQEPGETRKDTLVRVAPVLRELLPEFDYLIKDGQLISWNSLKIQNSLFPQLTNNSLTPDIAKTIIGNNESTLKSIITTNRNLLDEILEFWIDGKPQGRGDYADEGDGTVLKTSASLSHLSIPNYEFNLDHGEIISSEAAISEIFSLLGKTLPDKEYSSIQETENYLVFVARSPVKLSSPQATSDQHLHSNLIIIPNPDSKTYNLQITGTGSGNYQLSVGQIFGDKVIWNDYYGKATPSSKDEYSFNISLDTPLENPLIDENNSLKKLIVEAINELKDSVNQQEIETYHKDFLLYYLDNILSQIDSDPQKAIFYSNLFRDGVNFCNKSNFLSNQTALMLLNKTNHLSTLLEILAFHSPQEITQEQAEQKMNSASKAKEWAEENIRDKSKALIYLQAMEKLNKATLSENLYQKYLLSSQAQFLFLESKLVQ